MATIAENINRAITVLDDIKKSISDNGVSMADNPAAEEYPERIASVHDAGVKSAYDAFWDTFQDNGARKSYEYAFKGPCWTLDIMRPKYDITFDYSYGARGIFYGNTNLTDFQAWLDGCGIAFNSKTANNMDYVFYNCSNLETIDVIDCSGAYSLYDTFYWCKKLKTIGLLKLRASGNNTFSYTFSGCSNLENLTVEGYIGGNGLDLSACTKLTHDSLVSVINALMDRTSATSTYSIKIGSANKAKLTDEEIAVALAKGWVIN